MRRRAGRLGAEHAVQAMSGGFGPVYDLVVVAALMRMRRNARTPDPRSDRTLTARVPGAEITINRSRLAARSPGGGIALALEGPWDDRAAARLADAMLRDLAPAGRHLTRTTEPRGHYRNESGSRCYDGSSWALCSCGWYYPAGDRMWARAGASGTATTPGTAPSIPTDQPQLPGRHECRIGRSRREVAVFITARRAAHCTGRGAARWAELVDDARHPPGGPDVPSAQLPASRAGCSGRAVAAGGP